MAYTVEELELVSRLYQSDHGLGDYECSFKQCLEILRRLNVTITCLYEIEASFSESGRNWAYWYILKRTLPTLKDIANYIDFARTGFMTECSIFGEEERDICSNMATAVKHLRYLDNIDFEASFGWGEIDDDFYRQLRYGIFGDNKTSRVLNDISVVAETALALENLREKLFRSVINWDFVYDVGLALAENENL